MGGVRPVKINEAALVLNGQNALPPVELGIIYTELGNPCY